MDRVRLGLIGAGGMANAVHYPSLVEHPAADLVALCDIDEERLASTAAKFGIEEQYTDYREMLDAETLDAVYVLMPPHQLFDIVMDIIERKLHIFIEKPPGVTADQTHRMAIAAEEQGVLSMVGFNRRHAPLIVKAAELVKQRGHMLHCVSTFYKAMAGGTAHPYYRGAIDILRCDAIHAVDMLRYMGGEVANVASDVQAHEVPYDNMFTALLKFESGAAGVLLANWNVGTRRHQFEMHGDGITAFVNPDEEARVWADGAGDPEVWDTKEIAGSDDFRVYYGFAAENAHFVESVLAGREPDPGFADAAKSMALAERIYAAAW